MFGKMLKEAMREKGMNAATLSATTGIGKSSISQYLSGKNQPGTEREKVISEGLGFPSDYFEKVEKKIPYYARRRNLPVTVAAKLLGKSRKVIYDGLQQNVFPWGYAVKTSENRWTYIINARRFAKIEMFENVEDELSIEKGLEESV